MLTKLTDMKSPKHAPAIFPNSTMPPITPEFTPTTNKTNPKYNDTIYLHVAGRYYIAMCYDGQQLFTQVYSHYPCEKP